MGKVLAGVSKWQRFVHVVEAPASHFNLALDLGLHIENCFEGPGQQKKNDRKEEKKHISAQTHHLDKWGYPGWVPDV